ncbi:replication initiation factor domain-containing protein [Clostridium paridis]|uniref:Replication initiation factor domain-containing protein n=1 Tax=Clostridium paridis TaxID=2803863 RepID=A0A937FHB3_9CLOT|nr:replication initiation factor domain-containing protein [Clostridium paridis]MBL4932282.1 replication initiation factor domain-containing protein [Clostridium paridis]
MKPPASNTGVLSSFESYLNPVVDWVQVTFKKFKIEKIIKDVLKLEAGFFTKNDFGFYGYKYSYQFNDILVLYNGDSDVSGMGVHLQMSGKGCRQLDFYLKAQQRTWKDFFMDCFNLETKCNFSRLDVSIDDVKTYFKIPQLVKKIKAGEIVSKFKYSYNFEKLKNSDGSNAGTTLYMGSPTSNVRFRFYEKNYEQAFKQGVEVEEIGDWNRYEIQMRNENATECAKVLSRDSNILYVVKSILNNYVRFTNKSDTDKYKYRWKTWRNWERFIEDAGNLSLYIRPEPKTFEDTYRWLIKQTSNSLKTVEIIENSLGINGELIERIMNSANLKPQHYEKIVNYLKQKSQFEDMEDSLPRDIEGRS